MLLLDEPLSALDAHTKVAVRGELQELLREFGLPTLLVTHDYEDAAALADQVGVIVDGELRQLASPQEMVAQPGRRVRRRRSPARTSCTGCARPAGDGLTEIVLDERRDDLLGRRGQRAGRAPSSTRGRSRSAHEHQPDSAQNVIRGEIRSIVHVGNRVRVRIGPVTAEVTAAVGREARARGRHGRRRLVQGDRHAARRATVIP